MPSNRTKASRATQKSLSQRNAPLSSYIAASQRGPASLPSDERFPICTRDSSGGWCAVSRLGVPRKAQKPMRAGSDARRSMSAFLSSPSFGQIS
ncbi:hypothetical protein FB451DRAFT_1575263 [Mycena latifolia]|nr:hypothetical protein FB451DRAFT_1575263 [Mycena latifolia]